MSAADEDRPMYALPKRVAQLQMVFRHGEPVREYRCPSCTAWKVIDDDQFNGRASMYHDGCEFHETIDLATAAAR